MTHYPKEVINGNHRLTYKWKCPLCKDCVSEQDSVMEFCQTCLEPVHPELVKREKIDSNIPDPEPDPDIPF